MQSVINALFLIAWSVFMDLNQNNIAYITVIYGIILMATQPAKQFTIYHRYLRYYFYCKQPAKNHKTIYHISPLFTVLFLWQHNQPNNLPYITVIYGIIFTANNQPKTTKRFTIYHRYLRYYSYGKTTSRTPPNNLPLYHRYLRY